MIKKSFFVLIIISIFSIYSCKQEKKVETDANPEQEVAKDISELTYPEIFYLLHDEEEYGMDVHGDLFGQDAMSDVSLDLKDGAECGDAVWLSSAHSDKNIKVAVRTTFNLPGNPANEMFRAYVVKPGESLPVGHNLLCYQGKEFQINREIASAGFTTEE